MVDSGAYYPNTYFPPLAKIDEYVAIARSPTQREYYRVTWLEPIPLFEKGFLLAPGQTLIDQELTELIVGEDEILQMRIALDGLIKVKAKLPKATSRWLLRKESAFLTADMAEFPRFPPISELFVIEDNSLYVDIQNLNVDRYEYGKIYVTGYRLVVEPVKEKPRAYTVIISQGFAPRTRIG